MKKTWLEHPLLLQITGFLMTGFVGIGLTSYYSEKSKEREVEIAEKSLSYDLGFRAIQDFSDRYNVYVSRANMLLAAIKRKRPVDELMVKMKEYDDAYFDLSSKMQPILLKFRQPLVSIDQYPELERIIKRPTEKLNTCLILIFDAAVSHGKRPSKDNINTPFCETERLLYSVVPECGNKTYEELYRILNSSKHATHDTSAIDLRNSADQIGNVYCYIGDSSDYVDRAGSTQGPDADQGKRLTGF